MDGYIGETKLFAGPYAPVNWLLCQGQTLAISQYNSLYAIIGTQFGGDGISNFNLPDLRGRVPVGAGTGPGLTPRSPGQSGGAEGVTLVTADMPAHAHQVKCDVGSTGSGITTTPQDNLPANLALPSGTGGCYGADETNNPIMKADTVNTTGSGTPHENMPPWACINYIICYQGIWPPKN